MTTGIVRVGRWRLELSAECWRVRRRARVVLWGGRPGEVQLGSREDRLRELEAMIMGDALRSLRTKFLDHLMRWPARDWGLPLMEAGTAMPAGWIGRDVGGRQWREVQASPERDAADDEKLRAYSGARGWSPEDGDQA